MPQAPGVRRAHPGCSSHTGLRWRAAPAPRPPPARLQSPHIRERWGPGTGVRGQGPTAWALQATGLHPLGLSLVPAGLVVGVLHLLLPSGCQTLKTAPKVSADLTARMVTSSRSLVPRSLRRALHQGHLPGTQGQRPATPASGPLASHSPSCPSQRPRPGPGSSSPCAPVTVPATPQLSPNPPRLIPRQNSELYSCIRIFAGYINSSNSLCLPSKPAHPPDSLASSQMQ